MSLSALFVYAAVAMGQPAAAPPLMTEVVVDDRTPIRCRPAPYYVAEQGARMRPERLMVTGSRVPLVARDYESDRRPKPPCLLMRYEAPNPLRPAD
jgi:hypothetical protein